MSYFRLLNERCVEKALTSLFSSLALQQVQDEFPALTRELTPQRTLMEFEGFSLFMPGGAIKPHEWFSLRTSVGTQEILRLYDKIALAPIAELESAGEIASHLYPRNSDNRVTLSKLKAPGQWLSAALMFAASAQKGAEVEVFTEDSVRMRLGTGLIDISPKGCWSNSKRTVIPAAAKPSDLGGIPITTFPSAKSTNPAMKALYTLADGSNAQYAITLLAHAIDHEKVSKAFVNRYIKPGQSLLEHATNQKLERIANAKIALAQCDELLENGGVEEVQALFDAAVPSLMSFNRLQAIVGTPSQFHTGRKIKKATLVAWRHKLHDEFDKLQARGSSAVS